jgi:hypothetical protein
VFEQSSLGGRGIYSSLYGVPISLYAVRGVSPKRTFLGSGHYTTPAGERKGYEKVIPKQEQTGNEGPINDKAN